MARLCRSEVIDPREVSVVHVINRTVRRCFLFGNDPVSGKNFDHRKAWIEELLEQFAAQFGIDLLCFAILSNHYHLILRTRPDVVASWDDREVARRWLLICPQRKIDGRPAEPSEPELSSICNCPAKLAQVRERLSNVSWWMRLLNQRVAQRANREEEEQGRFWQDRFRAIRIVDEESLLACAAYVDLNPIRAGLAETVEASDHTSVQARIKSEQQSGAAQNEAADKKSASITPGRASRSDDNLRHRDRFLAPLTLNEAVSDSGPSASRTGFRCSDKGFLAMNTEAYLELLDWTARQSRSGKTGSTPDRLPPILQRLGLAKHTWLVLVANFEQLFCYMAGRCDQIDAQRSYRTSRRFRVRPNARKLLPARA